MLSLLQLLDCTQPIKFYNVGPTGGGVR